MSALEAMQRDLGIIAKKLPLYDGPGYAAAAERLEGMAETLKHWAAGFPAS
jgi:hypothetical protein